MDAGRAARAHPAPGAHDVRRRARRDLRAQHLRPAVRRHGRVPRHERAGDGHTGRPARVPRPERHARGPGRAPPRRAARAATTGAAIDPCAALQCTIELAAGRDAGGRRSCSAPARTRRPPAQALAEYRDVARARAARGPRRRRLGRAAVGVITVRTPEPAFDAMLNRWTLYQALACRMWGTLGALPEQRRVRLPRPAAGRDGVRLRRAGARARAHPARGGPPVRRGRRAALVAPAERARRADPVLRRPRVAARTWWTTTCASPATPRCSTRTCRSSRCARSGRTSTRSTTCRRSSDEHGSVYEHCLRALRRACTTGAHGLPLIGSGDWNDGMNRVGVEGRGESVWLAWFLDRHAARRSPSMPSARGDAAAAAELPAQADALRGGGRGARLGRRVVSPRVLRRRHAARVRRERRVPDRLDRPELERDLRRGRSRRGRRGRCARSRSIWCGRTRGC